MHERDCEAALADGGSDALHRARTNVAAREDARHARLEEVPVAIEVPLPLGADVGTREHVAARVERDLGREPVGVRIGADEEEEPARLEASYIAGFRIPDIDRFEGVRSVSSLDLRARQNTHV